MAEETHPSYTLLCSACYSPCSGADSHVIPRWNMELRRIFTTYRCGNCWLRSLAETRAAVTSGEAEVLTSFCDFLARHGYSEDADTIRAAPSGQAHVCLLAILDAVQEGKVIFHP